MVTWCDVNWGSHACYLERGHDGPCWCDCCDCAEHPDPGSGCVAGPPYYGPQTTFYGDDVEARGLPGRGTRFPCNRCGALYRPGEESDPCLGDLPGVWVACCGHASGESCYLSLSLGIESRGMPTITLYGAMARFAMHLLGGSPPAIVDRNPPDQVAINVGGHHYTFAQLGV